MTAGGRVLTVVASGSDYRSAIDRAYEAVGKISFDGMHYRKDIGARKRVALDKQMTLTPLQVLILMGSQNDAPVMQGAVDVLKELGISVEMTVASAHRSPERVMRLLGEAGTRGVSVFIVGAGAAAHLGGVVAAHVTKPVIGVPIDSSALNGLDALLVDRSDAARRAGCDGVDRQARGDERRRPRRADSRAGRQGDCRALGRVQARTGGKSGGSRDETRRI